eukprot:COSAG02_NODE_1521_length_12162_cov_3.464147_3_plen_74_part_00
MYTIGLQLQHKIMMVVGLCKQVANGLSCGISKVTVIACETLLRLRSVMLLSVFSFWFARQSNACHKKVRGLTG